MDTNQMILQLMEIVTDMAESQRRLENTVNERFDATHKEFNDVKLDVLSIKMTIENEINPAIKVLSEGQVESSKRLRNIENDITEIKDNSAIDEVLQDLRDMKRI